jgi:hypothetical protein
MMFYTYRYWVNSLMMYCGVAYETPQACSLLQYAIRRISDAGHHKEIASITNANAFFTVFNGVLVDSFCRVSVFELLLIFGRRIF